MAYADLVEFDENLEVSQIPVSEVNFYNRNGDVVADFAGTEVLVENSTRLFGNTFGIPYKFVQELRSVNPNTLANVFSDMRNVEGDKDFLWGVIGDTLASCGPAKKPHIPFTAVGDALVNKGFRLGGELGEFGNGLITATHEDNAWVEVREGDVLNSGVRIQMSPLMLDNPIVSPWSYRKVCDNGMTRYDDLESVKVIGRDVDTVMEQINNLADKMFGQAESLNRSFASMTNHRIDVFRAIRNMASAHRVSRGMREDMFNRAANLPSDRQTMYDALNIFTEVARDIGDINQRGNMQALAGTILSEEELRCESCGHSLD